MKNNRMSVVGKHRFFAKKANMMRCEAWIFFVLICLSCGQHQPNETPQPVEPVDLVYPLLDAANSRWFFFNSASRPFGMVNLSPDTELNGSWGSGYRYYTDTIKGFSHIHGWQISGVSVMPITLAGDHKEPYTDYYSKFSHELEQVEVGYHKVELERYGITAELTSTHRVGFHRYTFPEGEQAAVLFQLEGQLGPSKIINGSLTKIDDRTILGQITNAPTIRRPKNFTVFFVAKFNQDFSGIETGSSSKNTIVHFTSLAEPLKMKVAISYTSQVNAVLNMNQELDHWAFDQVVQESKDEWNSMLKRITVEGGTHKDQRRFYTDLWHALQGRRTISDVNGAYPDNTGDNFRIGQLPLDAQGKPLFRHFNSDAFYGTHWSINTLWGLAYPEIYNEFVASLLVLYQDGGLIPRGPSGGNYTFVMTGSCMTSFIVSAYQKGIRGYDAEQAYEGLKKNHLPGGMMGHAGYEHKTAIGGGVEHYIKMGYVPYPLPEGNFGFHQDGAGMVLEYAYQDWVLAQFARELGYESDYEIFMKRSENYKNVWDAESGWMRAKDVNGKWYEPFDPYTYQVGFIESNAAQATWSVPHDLAGLADLMGGKERAAERLDQQFKVAEKLNFTAGSSHDMETHPEYRRIPINYGNQLSMQTAFIFNYLGRPDLTQYWSRKVTMAVHSDLSPDRGYSGDEDQGLMGAIAVDMKMGIFQMNGGTEKDPGYELGSPLFDKVTIQLNPDYYPGEKFTIEARQNTSQNCYIKSAVLNSKKLNGFVIRHSDIVKGGELVLEMADKP